MKKTTNTIYPTLFLFCSGIVYAVLFYHAEMGINLLLFDALIIIAALKCRPELARNKNFIWSVGGLLFAALSVIIVHGREAIFAHHLTYLLVLGFAQARELRFVWYGLLLGLISLLRGPIQWLSHRKQYQQATLEAKHPERYQLSKWLRQAGLPLIILTPFLLFYLLGNSILGAMAEKLLDNLGYISIGPTTFWVLFLFFFGLLLVIPLFFSRLQSSRLVLHQSGFQDKLRRKRYCREQVPVRVMDQSVTREKPVSSRKTLALRGQYRQAVITFVLLNTLITIVNVTDLAFVWLPADSLSAATLSHYVHVGTWNLTFSIGLAMLVVLYYFRGNLNFLANAPLIRPLARLWLAQNAVLALSVGIRNYHYIDAYGLAGGRVIVGFVLLLILFGLFTLLRKIDQKLSLTYLLQTNGIAAWLLLLAFGAINWSSVITRYNISAQTAATIDWDYLRSGLDRRNTFLLLDHPEAQMHLHVKSLSSYHSWSDWRSWNYADWRSLHALEQKLENVEIGSVDPVHNASTQVTAAPQPVEPVNVREHPED